MQPPMFIFRLSDEGPARSGGRVCEIAWGQGRSTPSVRRTIPNPVPDDVTPRIAAYLDNFAPWGGSDEDD